MAPAYDAFPNLPAPPITNEPVSMSISPLKVLTPVSVNAPVDAPSIVNAPAPEITPESVWSAVDV